MCLEHKRASHECPTNSRLTVTTKVYSNHSHDDIIKWKHFPRYWPSMRVIHRSSVNSPHKGQWRGALMFSLISAWINGWVNNRKTGDLRRHRTHYDVMGTDRHENQSVPHDWKKKRFWRAVVSTNLLWHSDAIWRHISGSTLAQIIVCCLTTPINYLYQCWLIIKVVMWHSSENNFTSVHELNL